MDRSLCHIKDFESVPLQIVFLVRPNPSDTWTKCQSLEQMLARALPTHPHRVEPVSPPIEGETLELFVEWVSEDEAETVFDCIERAFPEAASARLGSQMRSSSQSRKDVTDSSMPIVHVPSGAVEFEDQRRIVLPAFSISRRQVTVAQFLEFTSATNYLTNAERENHCQNFLQNEFTEDLGPEQWLDMSAVFLSKDDALAYCAWSHTRLPTEAEWLAAAVLDWTSRADRATHE